jgi:glycine reductase
VSAPNPSLELAAYEAGEVEVTSGATGGDTSSWNSGRLTVDADAIATVAATEPAIEAVRVDVVRPGDSIRIANVLDVVEPAVRVADPAATFPGALGELALAGRGRTNMLEGLGVVPVARLAGLAEGEAADLPDSFIDMDGPGAAHTRWSSTTNVVLDFDVRGEAPVADIDRAIRRAALRTARDLAAATIGAEPGSVETIPPPGAIAGAGDLPSVAVILQVGSEGPLLDTYYYGNPLRGCSPIVVDPREVLDGALTNGAYDWAAARNPTAFYQRNTLVRELTAMNGERLRFAGVIVALGYLDSGFEKARSAMLSAQLAQRLGADGVVCTTFETGNSHTDTMLTVRACERLGIRSTAILAESNGGLTDHVPEADCLVSVGNEEELVGAWTPARVIGGGDARVGRLVPGWAYLGGASQMGDMRWTAVPS